MPTDLSYPNVILHAVIMYFVLLIYTRVVGKKQVRQLTYFNYILGITVGSMVANMVLTETVIYIKYVVVITIWFALTFLLDFLSIKSSKLSTLLTGHPVVVIKEGKIIKKSMTYLKLTMEELMMRLRENDVFSIEDVEYAIFEPDGKASVLKKETKQPVTKTDVNITPPKPEHLPTELIIDGRIITKNLDDLNLTKDWFLNQLKKRGIHDIKDILIAQIQPDGRIDISFGADEGKKFK